jgi:hypothetical protein
MTPEEIFDLGQISFRPGLWERLVDAAVEDDNEPGLAAKSRILSSAGSRRLATSPAIFEETNSLWMLNSPIPVNTPGNVRSTRRIWSAAYMSVGLNPVIIGSNRACSSFVSDLYCIAM